MLVRNVRMPVLLTTFDNVDNRNCADFICVCTVLRVYQSVCCVCLGGSKNLESQYRDVWCLKLKQLVANNCKMNFNTGCACVWI